MLSVFDGRLIHPRLSFEYYTIVQRLPAAGTVSVPVGEVAGIGLQCHSDPEPFPEHAVIDFTGLTSPGRRKAKAQVLAERARQRDWTCIPAE